MGCKKNMIKLLLVVFNVIAVIIGLALLGIGAYSKYEYGDVLAVTESTFTSIPAMLMVLGVLVFVLGFFGCFGSFRENRALLIVYTILLVLVLMGEVVAIIISLIYKGKISESVEEGLEKKVGGYIKFEAGEEGGTEDDKDIIDKIQTTLECCGIHGPATYTEDAAWAAAAGAKNIPLTCCSSQEGGSDEYCNSRTNPNVYNDGCLDLTKNTLIDNAGLVIGITLGFIIIQMVGVCLGCLLCTRIARDGYKEV